MRKANSGHIINL